MGPAGQCGQHGGHGGGHDDVDGQDDIDGQDDDIVELEHWEISSDFL